MNQANTNRERRSLEGTQWLIIGIFLASTISIILLGGYAYREASTATNHLVQSNNIATATLSQQLVKLEFEHRIHTLESIAQSADFINHVKEHNEAAIREALKTLVHSHPRVVRAFVTSPKGLLWSDFPKAPESLGKNFSYREWFQGLSTDWRPYISKVYRRTAAPQPLIVSIASGIRDNLDNQKILGAVVYQVRLEGLADLLNKVTVGKNGYVILLDHTHAIASHPHANLQEQIIEDYKPLPIERFTSDMNLQYNDPLSSQSMVATFLPCAIGKQQWTVVAQQTAAEALAPSQALLWQIATAGALVLLVNCSLACLLWRCQKKIKFMYNELERLNNNLAIKHSEQSRSYRALLSNLPGMAYRCLDNDNWTMLFVSEGCLKLTGYQPDEIVNDRVISYADIIHPDDRDEVAQAVTASVSQQKAYTVTYRITRKDDTVRWLWEQGNAFYHDDGKSVRFFEGFVTDITNERLLQDQLTHAQKLESVGLLAGGIAHDFNNLLMIIKGYVHLALKETAEHTRIHENLTHVKQAGERAARLTRQLLAFSRRQIIQPVPVNLNTTVHDVKDMIERLIGENIQISIRTTEHLDMTLCDPGQIEQIILNLCVNARDAMPNGGNLTIETANVFLDQSYVNQHPEATPGHHVMLAISDTGMGMDKKTKDKIFEPFFTTKKQGVGTGLGLATVYGIVKQSGGTIWVYSELEHGTTFKLYFPRTNEETQDNAESDNNHPLHQGTETILIAEDDEGLRPLLETILADRGYTVLTAANGLEAIQLCQNHDGDIHMLLTDVIMPNMSGKELAQKILRLRPDTRIVFMSGYTDTAISHHGVLNPGVNLIEKPISPDDLLKKIREYLC